MLPMLSYKCVIVELSGLREATVFPNPEESPSLLIRLSLSRSLTLESTPSSSGSKWRHQLRQLPFSSSTQARLKSAFLVQLPPLCGADQTQR